MSTTNEANTKDKQSKGGATEEDRSKGMDSAGASAETRARGGVGEDDRSKSFGPEDSLKG
jgi:hypothetical protein